MTLKIIAFRLFVCLFVWINRFINFKMAKGKIIAKIFQIKIVSLFFKRLHIENTFLKRTAPTTSRASINCLIYSEFKLFF